MDVLRKAIVAVHSAENYTSTDEAAHIINLYMNAQAHAAIAQAEQLKRIADANEAQLELTKTAQEQSIRQSEQLKNKVIELLDAIAKLNK